jgi:hypothetical protein
MEEQLIEFETAKLAKEKGFPFVDDYSYNWYDNKGLKKRVNYPGEESLSDYFNEVYLKDNNLYNGNNDTEENPITRYGEDLYLAPTQSLLQKWLREKHNIEVFVHPYFKDKIKSLKTYEVVIDKNSTTYSGYKTYEEALEKGLKKALKLINN